MEKSNSAQAECFAWWNSTPAYLEEAVVTSVSTSGQPFVIRSRLDPPAFLPGSGCLTNLCLFSNTSPHPLNY